MRRKRDMNKRYLPNSPYTLTVQVVFLTDNIFLQKFKCILSICSDFVKLNISEEYFKIEPTKESNMILLLLQTNIALIAVINSLTENTENGTDMLSSVVLFISSFHKNVSQKCNRTYLCFISLKLLNPSISICSYQNIFGLCLAHDTLSHRDHNN
jgi:hypothetical protein